MAATRRVNGTRVGRGARTCVVADGRFGRSVAARLLPLLHQTGHPAHERDAPPGVRLADLLWPYDAAVLAGDDDDAFDSAAFAAHTPWLAVVHEHPHIRVGPLVVPPAGPCTLCLRTRRAQHDDPAEAPGDDTTGEVPPHLVAVASGLASVLLGDVPAGRERPAPGRAFRVDVRTDEIAAIRVVPVHGCPRCDEPGTRSERRLARLATAVQGLSEPDTESREDTA